MTDNETIGCPQCTEGHLVASEHLGILGLYCETCGLFLEISGTYRDRLTIGNTVAYDVETSYPRGEQTP